MSEIVLDKPVATDETLDRVADALEARNDDMGNLAGLTTDAKTSLAAAINEVDSHADANAANITSNLSKINILIINGNWRTGLRFRNLGTSFTAEQQAALVAGDFSDYWNGDYWVINSVTWRIVDNSGWQNRRGDSEFNRSGLVLFPDTNLIGAEAYLIDDANESGHGYSNCAYRTRTDGKGKAKCLQLFQNAFGSAHIASHKELMSTSRGAGGATGWAWQSADVELPSEVNIYGHPVWGSAVDTNAYGTKYNIGDRWGQWKLFELAPYMAINRSQNYWLRDIAAVSQFAFVNDYGGADAYAPSRAHIGVRPYAILV